MCTRWLWLKLIKLCFNLKSYSFATLQMNSSSSKFWTAWICNEAYGELRTSYRDNEQRGLSKSRHPPFSRCCRRNALPLCVPYSTSTPLSPGQDCHYMVPNTGKRKRGWPKITWLRTFMDDLKTVDIAWDEAEAVAADWRWRLLAAQCTAQHRWKF